MSTKRDAQKRADDIAFLEWLRAAPVAALTHRLRQYELTRNAPVWKSAALRAAIKRARFAEQTRSLAGSS